MRLESVAFKRTVNRERKVEIKSDARTHCAKRVKEATKLQLADEDVASTPLRFDGRAFSVEMVAKLDLEKREREPTDARIVICRPHCVASFFLAFLLYLLHYLCHLSLDLSATSE